MSRWGCVRKLAFASERPVTVSLDSLFLGSAILAMPGHGIELGS
jgi:hypothetical protein